MNCSSASVLPILSYVAYPIDTKVLTTTSTYLNYNITASYMDIGSSLCISRAAMSYNTTAFCRRFEIFEACCIRRWRSENQWGGQLKDGVKTDVKDHAATVKPTTSFRSFTPYPSEHA